jgi:hypothetical protein
MIDTLEGTDMIDTLQGTDNEWHRGDRYDWHITGDR